DNITLDHLTVTGGYHGIYLGNSSDSDDVTISDCQIYGNSNYGIYLGSGNENTVISDNEIYGQGYYGIYVEAAGAVIRVNEIYGGTDYDSTGIYVKDAAGILVSGNTVYDNGTGIKVNHTSWSLELGVISGNTVFDNRSDGISVRGNILVSSNTVYGHDGINGTGIDVSYNARAQENIVFNNNDGIRVSVDDNKLATAHGNRVYNNSNIGIYAYNKNSIVTSNMVYSNSIGILGGVPGWYEFSGLIENNLVYANTNQGIVLENAITSSGVHARVINNTVYQQVGDAVRVQSNSNNVELRNNILWVEAGYGISVTSDSQAGFGSDYNLFYILENSAGAVGLWGGSIASTLTDWQAATGQGANSIEQQLSNAGENPYFIDIDGADNVMGYTTAGAGYDGGRDDNFSLARSSLAIDHADSFAAKRFDILGNPRSDDFDTPNAGSVDYVEYNLGAIPFDTVGIAQNWRYDDTYWDLSLPFTFNFYGVDYSSVYVASNGFLQFGTTNEIHDGSNSTAGLISHIRIAGLWDDLKTNGDGDDIYVDNTTYFDRVSIRWDATNKADDSVVNFAVILFDTGKIQFVYGAGNENLTPTIGISAGDGEHYQIGLHNNQPFLPNADTLEYTYEPGYADIGAYEFLGSSDDFTPPTVVSISPVEIETGGSTSLSGGPIQVVFSEALNNVEAIALTNYDLRSPGLDGIYDNADDVIYGIHDITYTTDTVLVTIPIDGGPWVVPGEHRFTINGTASIRDQAGNRLDGNNNGFEGGDYVRFFQVESNLPKVTATEINSGEIQRSTIFSLSVTFNQDVSVTKDALALYNDTTAATVNLAALTAVQFSYDNVSFTALWDLSAINFENGNYTATIVASEVADIHLNRLDGNGDGIEGDDYSFTFHHLFCDANGNRNVDMSDYNIWLTNYDPLGLNSNDPGNGDWNRDGNIDGTDILLWQINYDDVGLPLPSPPVPPIEPTTPDDSIDETEENSDPTSKNLNNKSKYQQPKSSHRHSRPFNVARFKKNSKPFNGISVEDIFGLGSNIIKKTDPTPFTDVISETEYIEIDNQISTDSVSDLTPPNVNILMNSRNKNIELFSENLQCFRTKNLNFSISILDDPKYKIPGFNY
ncbi:MAG: right-handed parallel beta-helix repeat-containing protein, partial [Planctomycetes bacterium]|nr:right-handed parallel beta-helix repeat-containing protein [Planctomycetota bacterium]